ncbi:MAG: aminotransferase class V-fold PLP-dependent enzyme [Thermomicrobiales bacterium]|nr:aminotransferase class V-fold PLP-dependent enzyme [Thermomicrobiales bacterium]
MSATVAASKLEVLRAQMPALQATGYFNAGTFGPMPSVGVEAAQALLQADFELGRIVPGGYERAGERNRSVVEIAAGMFGADAREFALTHSAGEGLNIALMGIAWSAGDEVITTAEEHPGLLNPLALLARRSGIVNRVVPASHDASEFLDNIERAITASTRVIALSHVLWSTGQVAPLREICELARQHELMVIVDAAQSAGQVPLNLHDLGVDAYAMAGQKWLCGPEGTGLLYVRYDRFADILPTYARYGQADLSGFFMPPATAHRYESGEFTGPVIAAQAATLTWLRDEVGMDWAYARIAEMGALFRNLLSGIPGVDVVTPENAMAGMVNFNVAGMHPRHVSEALYDRGYTIRFVEYAPCVVSARASVSWWNSEAEVRGLADAVAEIAAGSGAN